MWRSKAQEHISSIDIGLAFGDVFPGSPPTSAVASVELPENLVGVRLVVMYMKLGANMVKMMFGVLLTLGQGWINHCVANEYGVRSIAARLEYLNLGLILA